MSVLTELVLVRHGEAVINLTPSLDGVCQGLTERGRRQAGLLRDRLAADAAAGRAFDAAYHSTRARSAETARIVQPALGIPLVAHDGLRTMDHGEPGVNVWDPASNALGTIPPLVPDRPVNTGGESWQQYLDRSGQALLEIADKHAGQRVVVFGHSETSESACQVFMRLTPGWSRWTYSFVNHTGVTVWQRTYSELPGSHPDGQWILRVHNNDGHLPDGDRTW
ncbi:MAG TPA: histidine phosphatase family protein [Actinocrinis sp.]|nr:histidine phosphatase family protein [Actinocrinis sp.]